MASTASGAMSRCLPRGSFCGVSPRSTTGSAAGSIDGGVLSVRSPEPFCVCGSICHLLMILNFPRLSNAELSRGSGLRAASARLGGIARRQGVPSSSSLGLVLASPLAPCSYYTDLVSRMKRDSKAMTDGSNDKHGSAQRLLDTRPSHSMASMDLAVKKRL